MMATDPAIEVPDRGQSEIERFYMEVAGFSNIKNRTCTSMDGIDMTSATLPLCAFEPLKSPHTCNTEADSTLTYEDAKSACSEAGARLCDTADLIGNPLPVLLF